MVGQCDNSSAAPSQKRVSEGEYPVSDAKRILHDVSEEIAAIHNALGEGNVKRFPADDEFKCVVALNTDGSFNISPREQANGANNKCGIALKNGTVYIRGAAEALSPFGKFRRFKDCVFQVDAVSNSGRLVAIDFDQTLVEKHLFQALGGPEGEERAQLLNLEIWKINGELRKAFGTPERVSRIRDEIQACKDRGDLVCILSKGYATVIRSVLRYMNLDDLIPDELVYGCDCMWPQGSSKAERIIGLQIHFNRRSATLIDDDVVECVLAYGAGHDVVNVEAKGGMQEKEFKQLRDEQWDVLPDFDLPINYIRKVSLGSRHLVVPEILPARPTSS